MIHGRLDNKVCIITGAAQGIGLATCMKFAREGAIIIAWDLKQAGVDEALARCRALDAQAAGFVVDVTRRHQVDAALTQVTEEFGRVDVLVNNAGIADDGLLQEMTADQFDRVIDVNLRGVFHCAQAASRVMTAQGYGVILNASAAAGLAGRPGQGNYAASTHGVVGLTRTWSRELGPRGIRVNAVAPGFIMTRLMETLPEPLLNDMKHHVPLQRLGTPEQVANVYAFLASDEASYVSGAVIEVSGGMPV